MYVENKPWELVVAKIDEDAPKHAKDAPAESQAKAQSESVKKDEKAPEKAWEESSRVADEEKKETVPAVKKEEKEELEVTVKKEPEVSVKREEENVEMKPPAPVPTLPSQEDTPARSVFFSFLGLEYKLDMFEVIHFTGVDWLAKEGFRENNNLLL